MSASTQSAFQRAARGRYRFATVVGDGAWGVVVHCYIEKRIALRSTEDEARQLAAGKCRATPCVGNHTVEHFEPEPIPQPVWVSKIWED